MIVRIVYDLRSAQTTVPHPGEPTADAVLGPLASRRIHSAYPDLVGVSATYWNQTSGADEVVAVVAVETNIVTGPVPNLIVLLGDKRLSVAPSLLCECKDGKAVPRYHLERVALYNRPAQRAIVFDADGKRYEVEPKGGEDEGVRVEVSPMREALHIGMWLQPAQCLLMRMPDDAHPFPTFQEELREEVLWSRLLMAFIAVIDPENGSDVRGPYAESFGRAERSASDALWERFVAQILNVNPPEGSSFFDVPLPGRGAKLIRAIAAKHGMTVPDTYPS